MITVRESVPDRVITEIAKIFDRETATVTRDSRFVEDFDAKSLNYVQLIAVLDDAFGIDIPFMELRRKTTVGEAIAEVAAQC